MSNAVTAGRVARVDVGACTLLTDGGEVRARFRPDQSVAVGDYVTYLPGDPPWIAEVQPRRSVFTRAAAGRETKEQVVAANVDVVLLVSALDAAVNVRRIERALAVAWQSGALPVVVLTKSDLVAAEARDEALEAVRGVALGVDVHAVSATTGDGVDGVAAHLQPGATVALLGTSGAGKSTLVNRLAGFEAMATGEVRRDGKGRHTTTHRELVPLPGGAFLLDTPGMRELGLWDAAEGIERVFADVEALAGECRFGDCSHASEPGCAVRQAIEEGRLDPDRVESWHKLQREQRYLERRQDARLKAEEQRRWKAIGKAQRDLTKLRGPKR